MKYWKYAESDQALAGSLAEKYRLSPMVSGVMCSRGLDAGQIDTFFRSTYKLHDPYLMRGMDKAVEIILQSVQLGEKIAIFGDYDCDGVTATAMLYHYLTQVGADVIFYIPNREGEGYGISQDAIRNLNALGIQLIITVDNGISAIEEAKLAAQLGIKLVITDHHTPRDVLPVADAIINPHQPDCPYPFKQLCGAGVVFKLICALDSDEEGYDMLEEYADLLTIGTVADVVELRDENRFFVKRGLENLANTHRVGIKKLMEMAGLDTTALNSESISFGLAPRINAAGRIDCAEIAVLLLLTERDSEADEIIAQMEGYNSQRKQLEKQVIDDISAQIAADPQLLGDRVLVFSGEGWNAGIVGIVCSRLVNRFGKPCIIICMDGEDAKASGRSIEGFSLIEAVFHCCEYLSKYGGHPMAAGFSLKKEHIGDFRRAINAFAKDRYYKMPVDSISIHYECNVNDLSLENIEGLDVLEPFGAGNEKPNLCVRGAILEKIVGMSEDKHQRLLLSKDGTQFTVLFFATRRDQLILSEGDVVDVAFSACINVYNNQRRVTLKGIDLRPSGLDQEEYFDSCTLMDNYYRGELKGKQYIPLRDEIAVIYRMMKKIGRIIYHLPAIYFKCQCKDINYLKFILCIEIMLERGLLLIAEGKEGRYLAINPHSGKVQLELSPIIRSLDDEG